MKPGLRPNKRMIFAGILCMFFDLLFACILDLSKMRFDLKPFWSVTKVKKTKVVEVYQKIYRAPKLNPNRKTELDQS